MAASLTFSHPYGARTECFSVQLEHFQCFFYPGNAVPAGGSLPDRNRTQNAVEGVPVFDIGDCDANEEPAQLEPSDKQVHRSPTTPRNVQGLKISHSLAQAASRPQALTCDGYGPTCPSLWRTEPPPTSIADTIMVSRAPSYRFCRAPQSQLVPLAPR